MYISAKYKAIPARARHLRRMCFAANKFPHNVFMENQAPLANDPASFVRARQHAKERDIMLHKRARLRTIFPINTTLAHIYIYSLYQQQGQQQQQRWFMTCVTRECVVFEDRADDASAAARGSIKSARALINYALPAPGYSAKLLFNALRGTAKTLFCWADAHRGN